MKNFEERNKRGDPFAVVVWRDLGAQEEGEPHALLESIPSSRTFQVSGEFDGAYVDIKGSIIKEAYDAMSDGQFNSLFFSEPAIKQSRDMVTYVKPIVVGGGENTKITVSMAMRK